MYCVKEIYTKVILVKGSLEFCKKWIKHNCKIDEDGLYRDCDNEIVIIIDNYC